MNMTNNGADELSINNNAQLYITPADGVYPAVYSGFKPYAEDGMYGHKEGARLQFKITGGKFANANVSFKGNFMQDQQTGRYVVGMRSKLAEAIRVITGGTESLNKGHIGTKVLIKVKTNVSKKNGNTYANVELVMPMPAYEDTSAAPATQQVAQTVPGQAQVQATQPAAVAHQASNDNLLNDLTDLTDLK